MSCTIARRKPSTSSHCVCLSRGSFQPLSLLPLAAKVGAISSSSSSTDAHTMSPPCQITSTPANATRTSGHSRLHEAGMCVSVIRPIRMRSGHHNGLDVDELADAEAAELAADARGADAAERQARVGLDQPVDDARAASMRSAASLRPRADVAGEDRCRRGRTSFRSPVRSRGPRRGRGSTRRPDRTAPRRRRPCLVRRRRAR